MSTTESQVPTSVSVEAIDLSRDDNGNPQGVVRVDGMYYKITAEPAFQRPVGGQEIISPPAQLPYELQQELNDNWVNHHFRPFGYLSSEQSCRLFILDAATRNDEVRPWRTWTVLHEELVKAWGALDPKTEYLWIKTYSEAWWAIKAEINV